jgi:serine/threonine-protein kinase RsbW
MSAETVLKAHLVLSSRFENIEIAERTLVDLCRQSGCDGDDRYWLVTAMREAVANAIQHGNRQRPDRDVRVEFSISDCEVTMRIEDDGHGFDPESIPDPTASANLLQPSGRGIFYMRQFMTRVEFSRAPGGGTAVTMVRRLQPETRSSSDEE